MGKQMILLVTTIVFALLLCGAVSAEDSQGGENNQDIQSTDSDDSLENYSSESNESLQEASDPRIYGVLTEVYNKSSGNYTSLTDAIPVSGATVTIKNPTDDAVIATGTTTLNGKYDISFISALTEFKVEIAYSTCKTHVLNVTPTGIPIPEAE